MSYTKSLCVFCASSSAIDPAYMDLAAEMGRLCAENGWRLVYGGARGGMMGAMADAALAAGGHVEGVIPEVLGPQERAHSNLTRLHIATDMHDRQQKMAELADGFIVLPGGIGTLAEFFEIITWKAIGLHQKPVAIINSDDFWSSLLDTIEKCAAEGFLHRDPDRLFEVFQSPEEAIDFFRGKME